MNREIRETKDGSKTLYIKDLDENYHSHHGALQEAEHVFIKNGLNLKNNYEINILELGFGTGLNVLVTINELLKNDINHKIHYHTVEIYPVMMEEIVALDYSHLFENDKMQEIYLKIHACEWEKEVEILPNFYLTKYKADFYDIKEINLPPIDLVYFDCFGARVQPDLWEKPLLEIVANKITNEGLFTTYSSKGSVRRDLIDLGFEVFKKPGPPGKREMINAIKKS